MKVLLRRIRTNERDLQDIGTLLEIVNAQPEYLGEPWVLNDPERVRGGARGDAARVSLEVRGDRDVAARLRAMLQRHVAEPPRL